MRTIDKSHCMSTGKITLETYLSQLHIYLLANARTLLVYLPDLPLLNFSMATIVYLTLSFNLFNITTDVSAYLLPKDNRKLMVNFVCVSGLCLSAVVLSYVYLLL